LEACRVDRMRVWTSTAHGACLPRSHTSTGILEMERTKVKRWAGSRGTGDDRMPLKQRPDGTVAGSSKRLSSRFYLLKAGHRLTGHCGQSQVDWEDAQSKASEPEFRDRRNAEEGGGRLRN
jgi:hypothetical protein